MSDDLHDSSDESLERIVRALRTLPEIDPAAKARVLVAVAADRARGDIAPRRSSPLRVAALLALAAGLVAVVVLSRGEVGERRTAPEGVASGAARSPQAALAANVSAGADAMLVPIQLVVRAPNARRMSVVGDFTGWDEGRVAMTRDSASGLWSATVSVRPGRHVYAFVADDSVWMRDPRAPVVNDADFGRPGSLLLVGRP